MSIIGSSILELHAPLIVLQKRRAEQREAIILEVGIIASVVDR